MYMYTPSIVGRRLDVEKLKKIFSFRVFCPWTSDSCSTLPLQALSRRVSPNNLTQTDSTFYSTVSTAGCNSETDWSDLQMYWTPSPSFGYIRGHEKKSISIAVIAVIVIYIQDKIFTPTCVNSFRGHEHYQQWTH